MYALGTAQSKLCVCIIIVHVVKQLPKVKSGLRSQLGLDLCRSHSALPKTRTTKPLESINFVEINAEEKKLLTSDNYAPLTFDLDCCLYLYLDLSEMGGMTLEEFEEGLGEEEKVDWDGNPDELFNMEFRHHKNGYYMTKMNYAKVNK